MGSNVHILTLVLRSKRLFRLNLNLYCKHVLVRIIKSTLNRFKSFYLSLLQIYNPKPKNHESLTSSEMYEKSRSKRVSKSFYREFIENAGYSFFLESTLFLNNTYNTWPLKQRDDSVGLTLLLPPTSSCQADTVPSSALLANLWPHRSNCKPLTDARGYGGGTLAAASTP